MATINRGASTAGFRRRPAATRSGDRNHGAPVGTGRWSTRSLYDRPAYAVSFARRMSSAFGIGSTASPELGERQDQPHQVRLLREGLLAVRSASGASGCFPGSPGRLGDVADALVFRQPDGASWRPTRDRCDGGGPARPPAPARQQRLGRPAGCPAGPARLGRVVERRRLGRQGPGGLLPPGQPPWTASARDEDAARGSRAEPCRPVVCTGRELASLSSAASSPGVVRRSTN